MRVTPQEYADLLQRRRGNEVLKTSIPRHAIPDTRGMNKLEARFAREVLDIRKMVGEILSWKYEGVKLRLADRTYYTPDFMVCFEDHIEMCELKGFWRDDARVKWKVAAEMFPEFQFVAVQWKKGAWIYEVCHHAAY